MEVCDPTSIRTLTIVFVCISLAVARRQMPTAVFIEQLIALDGEHILRQRHLIEPEALVAGERDWEDCMRAHAAADGQLLNNLFGDPLPAYMVDNQAIVTPGTIDAIRALGGRETNSAASMAKTEASLRIGSGQLRSGVRR